MRTAPRILALGVITSLVALWPLRALPCGGGFGDGLHIDPSQKILVTFDGATQRYVFSPSFCGKAANFGLILPIPGKLSENPALADKKLFDQLETLTAPTIRQEVACENRGIGGGRDAGASFGDAGKPPVEVIDRGQVGIFDWVLLKADNQLSFTDWLDAAGYPYTTESAQHFAYYVNKGWYFIAFKVTADTQAPPAGKQLCGELGPIALRFEATQAVVPARIAAVGGSSWLGWRIFTIAATQQQAAKSSFGEQLRYAGALTAADLGKHDQLAKIASAGQWVTKLDYQFFPDSDDIELTAAPTSTPFRQEIVQYTYIPCDGGVVVTDAGKPLVNDSGVVVKRNDDGGCAVGGVDARAPLLLAGLFVLLALVRRRRSR